MTPASVSNSPSLHALMKSTKKDKKFNNKLPSATTTALRKCREEAQKLPVNVSSYFFDQGKRLISLVIENQEKLANLKKLQQDEFVPRSLKSLVTLSGSNEVSRTSEFLTLATSLDTTSSVYSTSAKAIMVEAALLERNFRNLKIFKQFLNFCKLCYQYQIMELGAPSTTAEATIDDQELLFALFTEMLFCLPTFLENFREMHVDLPIEDLIATRAKVFPGVNDSNYTTFKNNINTTNDTFVQLLESVELLITNICLHPIGTYNTQKALILKEIQRRDFIMTQRALEKADTTTLMIEEEPTPTPRLLWSLISQELQKEFQKLNLHKRSESNKQMKRKNSVRGAMQIALPVSLDKSASVKNKSQPRHLQTISNGTRSNIKNVQQTSKAKQTKSHRNAMPKALKSSFASQKPNVVDGNANVGKSVKRNHPKKKALNKTSK
jgi:hypothetical protein